LTGGGSLGDCRAVSLGLRAVLAVALAVGFYGLALSIAGVLLLLAYFDVVHANRLDLRLLIFAVTGAGIILWAILPRRQRFVPRGVPVTPESEARLFAVLREVAVATGETMPADVYLVGDVNAFVTEQAGPLGFGRRRIMGIGLPLLGVLTVPELRGVIAHEFGHFYGGDTRLGPWVYRTRAALARTVQGLDHHARVLQAPFRWYGNLFLRVSHAVSRQQELTADVLGTRVAGAAAMASGLRKVHGAAMAFEPYWRGEVAPVLRSGALPPLAHGFARFLAAPAVAAGVALAVDQAMQQPAHDQYDTHPSLAERIRALGVADEPAIAAHEPPALELLADVVAAEQALVRALSDGSVPSLRTLAWERVLDEAIVPSWRDSVARVTTALGPMPLIDLADRIPSVLDLAEADAEQSGQVPDDKSIAAHATWLLGMTLGSVAVSMGWRGRTAPGDPILFESSSGPFDPFGTARELVAGTMDGPSWRSACTRLGLTDVTLAAVTPPAGAAG
jgi:Zn-dependent protease with chaperone function